MNEALRQLGEDERRSIKRKTLPDFVQVMKATLVHEAFSDPDWIFERKLDGYDLEDLPLRTRKKVLLQALNWKDPIRYLPHKNESGKDFFFFHRKLENIERKTSPFDDFDGEDGVHWVQPKYVGEIGFTEWTPKHRLRHLRFLGLRDDKAAKEVRKESSS